ncbi:hypothetical protein ACFV3R_25155 [Streptomyces sp. NPDC059740]|uniref:hypothetical protein n=1 Tax=Streptomyces sp. NPDC059740 TaxID=3346926 RepID=UPI0036558383
MPDLPPLPGIPGPHQNLRRAYELANSAADSIYHDDYREAEAYTRLGDLHVAMAQAQVAAGPPPEGWKTTEDDGA